MSTSIGSRARSRARTLVPALALVAGLMLVIAAPAYAATTVVNCPADDLTVAIASAAPGDTLVINGTCSGNFVIGKKLNLLGATGATLDGAFGGSTLTIGTSAKVKVTDLTITGGLATYGGGIYNAGTLTLVRTTVSGNFGSYLGGGIINFGALSVTNSTLSDNNGGGGGGAIQNSPASTLILSGSTLDGNSTGSSGGGIENNGTATVVNSTLSGNSAGDSGGGIDNNGTLTLSNATLSGNSTDGYGGGVWVGSTAVTFGSSILAGNSAAVGPDCYASTGDISNGYNLIGNADDCALTPQTGDQIGSGGSPINPLLGPLASNGGPTQTMALGLASTAVETIPVGALGALDSAPLCPSTGTKDQRGTPRPQGAACDTGAYEQAPWILGVTVDSGVGGSSPSVSGTIICSQGSSFAVSITLSQKKLKAVGTSPTAPCGGFAFAPWAVSVSPGTFAPGTAKVSFTATVGTVTSKGKVSITLT